MLNDSAMLLPFLTAIFFSSLSGSFGHCVGMCGGIVIGLNMKKNQKNNIYYKIIANIIYFLGRVTGYICIGVGTFIVGASLVSLSKDGKGMTFIFLGLLIILTSFLFTFAPRFLSNITPSGQYLWYKRFFSKALNSPHRFSYYLLGFLNGLLPCGFVYMFVLSANSTGNLLYVVITMFIFGLGTFISLFLVGIFGASFFNSKFRNISLKIAFIIMLYLGCDSIYKGYEMIKNTSGDGHHHHMSVPLFKHNETDLDHANHHSAHLEHSSHAEHLNHSTHESHQGHEESHMHAH